MTAPDPPILGLNTSEFTVTDDTGLSDPLPNPASVSPIRESALIRRRSIFLKPIDSAAALSAQYGRPRAWGSEDYIVDGLWGAFRVYAGGVDVTDFRGVRTEILSYQLIQPFSYGPAAIRFPQISPYDTLGSGALSWLVQGMNVEIKKLAPDGVTETTIWEGLAASWESDLDERGYTLDLQCMGAMFQANLEPMPPGFSRDRVDIGVAIKEAFTFPAQRLAAFPTVVTNVGTRNRGSWEPRLDYVQEILSTAYNSDGTLQWTVGCSAGRVPSLFIKNRTLIQWSMTPGTPGMTLRESSDITGTVNVIYGEGVSDGGGRWRNTRYPAAGPVFVPLTYVSQNQPLIYDGAGNATPNPNFDPGRLRIARYENYGANISKSDGVESARAELLRDVNPGWTATVTLKTDPEEGSRFDMRPGQNIRLRHHHGNPTRNFHIIQVDVNPQTLEVTLELDTNARDAITLAGLKTRNREAAADPARRINPPRRRSRHTPDVTVVFDAEDGAGLIQATAVTGGAWNVIRIPASRYGRIVLTTMRTVSPITTFAVGVFGQVVTVATLNSLVGNPLTQAKPWDTNAQALSDAGLQMAWGGQGQLGGYWPGDSTGAVTGVMKDDASWEFISATPPWIWLVVYPTASCTFSGLLHLAPEI